MDANVCVRRVFERGKTRYPLANQTPFRPQHIAPEGVKMSASENREMPTLRPWRWQQGQRMGAAGVQTVRGCRAAAQAAHARSAAFTGSAHRACKKGATQGCARAHAQGKNSRLSLQPMPTACVGIFELLGPGADQRTQTSQPRAKNTPQSKLRVAGHDLWPQRRARRLEARGMRKARPRHAKALPTSHTHVWDITLVVGFDRGACT